MTVVVVPGFEWTTSVAQPARTPKTSATRHAETSRFAACILVSRQEYAED
jgi:hypothetical protein